MLFKEITNKRTGEITKIRIYNFLVKFQFGREEIIIAQDVPEAIVIAHSKGLKPKEILSIEREKTEEETTLF